MIFLLIHRMSATFGKLQGRTLELKDGLNILQAPNETGKSTWCAFLVSMLYGVNSRERERAGFIPNKTRYAPWTGAAMSGRLDCRVGDAELTLTRTTRRQSAPMGDFQAVYAGTGNAVAGLTGGSCGETLLGVSREVFERSALIRQNGLAITQDAGLERRIAALITSGEEDTSYTEAAEALKKQLNRRRHNKTGQLPALEAERAELERQLAESDGLSRQLAQARAGADSLTARATALEAELNACDRWEATRRRQALSDAQAAAKRAETHAAQIREQLLTDQVPESETIARLRGAIVNLETTRKDVDKARMERDEAMKEFLRAEAAVNESPFAGQTRESAKKEASAPPAPANWKIWPGVLVILFGTLAAFGLLYAVGVPLTGSPWQKPAGIGALLAGLGVTYFLAGRLRRRAIQDAQDAALFKRFGTADLTSVQETANTYCTLLDARDAAQAEADKRTAAADTLYSTLSSNEQAILLEVRRFAPAVYDIPAADAALRGCASRRKELTAAETAAREARLRWEVQSQQSPLPPEESGRLPAPPTRERQAVEEELAAVQAQLTVVRSSLDRLSGQLHAVGDPMVLRSTAAHFSRQIQTLEEEYAAIELAMDALESANTTLQNRFSPALGRRAAEIFAQLTDHRYESVTLDRSFRLAAEGAGEGVYRDAALLSAGAADQLYLAARLAICDLVLPEEAAVPIILDDALSNFDDQRCAAALRWLKEESKKRQILLFTCHSREAEFFAGDGEVAVQRLTEAV